ncbi:MAG TPA: FtsX-like permease family protein [Candidatus Saccharimonadales bacterium]|nr:FtsX-like permease family protein [Candidatus Saccharimonadales bacterium]
MPPTLNLLFRNGMGNRVRVLLTLLVIGVAVIAFALLQTAIRAYYMGVEASAPDRLVTRHNVSLMFSLPLAYRQQIENVEGVESVAYGNWFGGYYQDERQFFAQFAIDDSYLDLYPEFLIPPDEKKAFLSERTACIVGEKLASRFGWSVGQKITLQGTIFPGDWDFTIRGIYRGRDRTTDTTAMFFRWDYLNEWVKANYDTEDRVGWYVLKIADPAAASRVSGAVDNLFENSTAQTLTETEQAFQMSFVSMLGAILVAIRIVSYVMVVIVLMVMANTMMMAARERLSMFAVLKTLGFRTARLAAVISGEALLISAAGAALGIAVAYPVIRAFGNVMESTMGSFFPVFELEPGTVAQAFGLCLLCGLLASVMPLLGAVRTPIATALRKVN